MIDVNTKQKITLTKGDTLVLTLDLKDADGNPYFPEEGDSLRFAISKGYLGERYYELITSVPIPLDGETLTFTVPSETTKQFKYEEYNYDVELTRSDGTVETVISSQIVIKGECQ